MIHTLLSVYLKHQRLLITLYSGKPFLVVVTSTKGDMSIRLRAPKKTYRLEQEKKEEEMRASEVHAGKWFICVHSFF